MCGDDDFARPAKRRRFAESIQGPTTVNASDGTRSSLSLSSGKTSRESTPAVESTENWTPPRRASQTLAPFLTEHLPQKFAAQGSRAISETLAGSGAGSKYCYRHHPDRQTTVDPSADQLQDDLQSLSQTDQQAISHFWTLFSAAPARHRKLMLQGVLSQCCFPQLSFLLTNVRELIKIDFLAALPPELGFQILRNLDTVSLCKAAQVNRRWRAMADDDVVWHRMCEQHIARKCTKCGWGLPLLDQKRLMASKHSIQLRMSARERDSTPRQGAPGLLALQSGSQPDSPAAPKVQPWKDVYRDRFLISSNWRHGRYTEKTFRGHTNGVMCLQFDDHVLATGSYDSTIKIWDVATGQELRTLHGHRGGLRTLQFDDTKLISGSLDHTIKVWNWQTGDCLRTISGHTGGVLSLHFVGTTLASGSMDGTVRIWNFEGGSAMSLRGHTDWVNCVRVDAASRTVFSASDDQTVRLWDLTTGKVLRTYRGGHVAQVQAVLLLPEDFDPDDSPGEPVASGSEADDDSAASTPASDDAAAGTNTPAATAPAPAPTLPASSARRGDRAFAAAFSGTGRTLPPRHMLTASLDGTIRLWDVHAGRCVRVSFGHIEGVWAVAADAMRIVSGAQDRTVKIWDARSGACERTLPWHAGPVTCVGMNDSRVASGGEDGVVKMLSFNYFRRAQLLAHDCA